MRMTLTPRAANARNTRSATPGTPAIPGPRSVSSERFPTDVIPFASFPSSSAVREMRVPGAVGLNVFLIRIGMRFATAGAMAAECSTFAPKYDSSMASSYVIRGCTNADGTTRGSALRTPSTSVQISMTDAPTAAPMMAAL